VSRWHRHIGLLVIGTSLVFAVSGIALNHQSHWDPYYMNSEGRQMVDDLSATMDETEIDGYLRERFGLDEEYRTSIRERPHVVNMEYASGISFVVDMTEMTIVKTESRKRPILYDFIQLHFNSLKGGWIALADVFAVGLMFLSFSGVYLAWGKFDGTDRVFLIAGILLPFLFYLSL
jgi:uncharacterized protein